MSRRGQVFVVAWITLLLGAARLAVAIDGGQPHARPAFPGPEVQRSRIHLLVGADTLDPVIGASVQRDVEAVIFAFVVCVPAPQLVVEVCRDEQVTRDDLLAAIDRLAVKGSDSLVFYWSGHGAHDENDHWLKMRRGPHVYRRELRERMLGKHARLNVLLSDCCNTFHPGTARPKIHAAPAVPKRVAPLFDALFFRSQGLADINSASENEVAMGTADGGLFTAALTGLPRNPGAKQDAAGFFLANQNQPLSWTAMVDDLASRVRTEYAALGDGPPTQKTQTVKVWSLPTAAPENTDRPPPQVVPLRSGDLILAINGQPIDSIADYWNAVKQSPPTMEFRVHREGRLADARMELRSGDGSRSGVAAELNPGGGVVVTVVYPGDEWPGNKVTVVQSSSAIRLEENDVIRSVNGRPIAGIQDYISAVKDSPPLMRMEVLDHRTGQTVSLQTSLRSGQGSRLGVAAVDNGGQGVRVTQVYPGYPGTRTERAP